MRTRIYQAHHRKLNHPYIREFSVPIQVGAELSKERIGYAIPDDSGDNISRYNPNFCELTALYWMWKNDSDSEIVGLEHYRRFFNVSSAGQIEELVGNDNIVVTTPLYMPEGVVTQYYNCHTPEYYQKMRSSAIPENERRKLDAAMDWLSRRKILHACNMFMMKKETMDEYCEWLFPMLLSGAEQGIQGGRDPGFISERLFDYWAHNSGRKVVPFPISFWREIQ